MARLYRFVVTNEKIKSIEDFLTQSQDGLSKTVHKGWLSVIRKNSMYEMHFTATHPLKLKSRSLVAYCKYPDNTVDNIFYWIPDKREAHNLPTGSFKQKV